MISLEEEMDSIVQEPIDISEEDDESDPNYSF